MRALTSVCRLRVQNLHQAVQTNADLTSAAVCALCWSWMPTHNHVLAQHHMSVLSSSTYSVVKLSVD